MFVVVSVLQLSCCAGGNVGYARGGCSRGKAGRRGRDETNVAGKYEDILFTGKGAKSKREMEKEKKGRKENKSKISQSSLPTRGTSALPATVVRIAYLGYPVPWKRGCSSLPSWLKVMCSCLTDLID